MVASAQTQLTYPRKYHPLLIKAGLIGSGVKIIHATVSDEKLLNLNEGSNTWEKSNYYKNDHRTARETFTPIVLADGRIKGDWKVGLTKEEIKIINEECNIPLYEADMLLPITHNKTYDLSKPQDMSEYRILMGGDYVSLDKTKMRSGQRFYIFCPETEQKQEKERRQLKRDAIKLTGQLTPSQKNELLQLMSFRWKLGFSAQMSNDEINRTFEDMAFDGEHYKIMTAHEMPDKAMYLLVHRAILANVIHRSVQDQFTRPDGATLADDLVQMIDFVKQDEGFRKEIAHKIEIVTSQKFEEVSANAKATDLGIVTSYDTRIDSDEDITFWPIEACRQYIKRKNWTTILSDADGTAKWKELVLAIHHNRATDLGSLYVEEPVKPYNPNNPTAKSFTLAAIPTWERNQCREFLAEYGVDTELKPTHGVEKWRTATLNFAQTLPDNLK